jgi:UDP-N-acetylmuramyl pentapeptide phosphotransferase/UDP-N-acetylglucosamine-1-phosphate transferase
VALVPILLTVVALAFATALVVWFAVGRVRGWLVRRAILDRPNDRSSHTVPTPRGGGIGVLIGLIPAWCAAALLLPGPGASGLVVAGIATALGCLSFIDDRRGLPAALRLGLQIPAVAVGVWLLPPEVLVAQGLLPMALDRVLAGFVWLWFVNLYNFMDGIDGITGVETASLGIGFALIAWIAGSFAELGWALALTGAAAGFLVWNWHPAKLFLGDVGSIPLGYLLGFLVLLAAGNGAWAAAVILPAYYWGDATSTLIGRLVRGEAIWRPHRTHAYQVAVQLGLSHDTVARRVGTWNLWLILLAYLSTSGDWAAVVCLAIAGAGTWRTIQDFRRGV